MEIMKECVVVDVNAAAAPLLSEILGAKRGEEEGRVSLSVVRSFVPPFSPPLVTFRYER